MLQIKSVYGIVLPREWPGNIIIGSVQIQPAIQPPGAAPQMDIQQRRLVHDFHVAERKTAFSP